MFVSFWFIFFRILVSILSLRKTFNGFPAPGAAALLLSSDLGNVNKAIFSWGKRGIGRVGHLDFHEYISHFGKRKIIKLTCRSPQSH